MTASSKGRRSSLFQRCAHLNPTVVCESESDSLVLHNTVKILAHAFCYKTAARRDVIIVRYRIVTETS